MIINDLIVQRSTKGKRINIEGDEWILLYHVIQDFFLAARPDTPLPTQVYLIQSKEVKLPTEEFEGLDELDSMSYVNFLSKSQL
jgi:hypothetical protein